MSARSVNMHIRRSNSTRTRYFGIVPISCLDIGLYNAGLQPYKSSSSFGGFSAPKLVIFHRSSSIMLEVHPVPCQALVSCSRATGCAGTTTKYDLSFLL